MSNCEPATDKRYVWKVEFEAHIKSVLVLSRGEVFVIESSAMRALTRAVKDILFPEHGSQMQVLKLERIGEVAKCADTDSPTV